MVRAMFYGLAQMAPSAANKNSIKIIGEDTENFAGLFRLRLEKSGSMTISHLRFGPKPIHSAYLVNAANFIACHQFSFTERMDVLQSAEAGAVFLLNSHTDRHVCGIICRAAHSSRSLAKAEIYVIDAFSVAKETAWAVASTPSCRPASLRSAASYQGRSHCRDQARHRKDLWQARRDRRPKEFCRRGPHAGKPARVRVPSQVTSTFDLRRTCRRRR